MFSMKQVRDIMAESLKMKAFSHPNVLSLIGVCTDAGESPYLVMPYMEKGSLLAYLKKERPNLTIAEGASEDLVSYVDLMQPPKVIVNHSKLYRSGYPGA